MANNPALAFLAGVRSIDNLEMNRLNRAIMKENQSRTRVLWDRQDQAYERLQLDQYRADKLAEFDATVQDIVANATPDELARINAPDAGKDGQIGGFAYVANEAMKRMVGDDAEFGEHIAQAFGINAADGPLVRDPTKPISGVGLLPPALAANGKGGVFFQVDAKNGHGPLTANRTDAANDQIFLGQVGRRELVGIFGKGVMSNDFAVAGMIRAAVGVDKVTGNPTQATGENTVPQTTRAAPGPERTAAPKPTGTPSTNSFLSEEELELPLEEQHALAEARRQAQIDEGAAAAETTPEEFAEQFGIDPAITQPGGAGPNDNVIANKIDRIIGDPEGAGIQPVDPAGNIEGEAGAEGFFGVEPGQDELATIEKAEQSRDEVSQEFLESIGVSEERLKSDKAAKTVSDVVRGGKGAGPFRAKAVANSPEAADTAIQEAAVPATKDAIQDTANTLLASKGRPTVVDIYNAAGLARLGVIDSKQLMNYAETGRFTAATKKTFHSLGNGNFAIFDQGTGTAVFGSSSGGAGQAASIKARQAFNNLLQDQVGGLFDDNPAGQDQFISSANSVLNILGFSTNTEQDLDAASDPRILRAIQQGTQFVSRFDPDTAQNLFQGTGDFNPLPGSDPSFQINPASMALGTAASIDGISSQRAANEYLTQYGGELLDAFPGMSAEQLYQNARTHESTVRARLAAGRNPKHPEHDKYSGQSRDKIRRELVEELIEGA